MPENKNYKYLLVLIDSYSNFVLAEPLKTKSKQEVQEAVDKIIKNNNLYKITTLCGDKEAAFLALRNYWKEKNITFFVSQSDNKAFLAENAIKNIKSLLRKYMKFTDNNNWVEHFPKILEQLNNRPLSSRYNITPAQLNNPKNDPHIKKIIAKINNKKGKSEKSEKKSFKTKLSPFKVGDFVFVDLEKKSVNFSIKQEDIQRLLIRKIVKIDKNEKPFLYSVETANGNKVKKKYYASQLKKTVRLNSNLKQIEEIISVKREKSKIYYQVKTDKNKIFWVDEKYLLEK